MGTGGPMRAESALKLDGIWEPSRFPSWFPYSIPSQKTITYPLYHPLKTRHGQHFSTKSHRHHKDANRVLWLLVLTHTPLGTERSREGCLNSRHCTRYHLLPDLMKIYYPDWVARNVRIGSLVI